MSSSRRYPEIVALFAVVLGIVLRLADLPSPSQKQLMRLRGFLGTPIHESDDLLVWQLPPSR